MKWLTIATHGPHPPWFLSKWHLSPIKRLKQRYFLKLRNTPMDYGFNVSITPLCTIHTCRRMGDLFDGALATLHMPENLGDFKTQWMIRKTNLPIMILADFFSSIWKIGAKYQCAFITWLNAKMIVKFLTVLSLSFAKNVRKYHLFTRKTVKKWEQNFYDTFFDSSNLLPIKS